jgi:hypothetical protein
VLRHEPVSSLPEQWADRLRFQPIRQATAGSRDGRVVSSRAVTIPPYTATGGQEEEIRGESLGRYGIPYAEAERNVQEALTTDSHAASEDSSPDPVVPPYEVVAV